MLSKAIKKNETLLTQFNRGLKYLKDSGNFQKMEQDFYSGKYE